jgi:hypothetical protein
VSTGSCIVNDKVLANICCNVVPAPFIPRVLHPGDTSNFLPYGYRDDTTHSVFNPNPDNGKDEEFGSLFNDF